MPQIGEIKTGGEIEHTGRKSIKYIWAKCIVCGKERWVRIKNHKARNDTCLHCIGLKASKAPRTWMIGEKNHQWKGGKYKNSHGYIITRIQPDSFFFPMAHKDGQVIEHRLVMAKYHNRCLLPWEVVHHKNGIKDDNRLENLELLPSSKYHLIDTEMKTYVKKLENENMKLRELLKGTSGI